MFEFEVDGQGIDFGLCVSTGQVFRWREVEPGVWEGAIGGGWWRVSIPQTHSPSSFLRVQSNQEVDEFVQVFGVDRDDEAWFAGVLGGDPALGEAVRACRGLRLIRQDDPVEVLFSFLCSANNHVKRIEGMVGCLAEFGEGYAFPSLEVLAEVEGQYLRERGFGYRAERIPVCAAQVLELGGLNWLNDLKGSSSGEAVLELQKLPGVGPKVAECVALFGLGHGNVVPIDTHIWNAVRRRYFPDLAGGSLTLGHRRMVGDFMRDRFEGDAGLAHLVLFVDEMRNWRSRR
ncbi:MAG: DNA glycosylase [Fimbriimonadaceae bacterium]